MPFQRWKKLWPFRKAPLEIYAKLLLRRHQTQRRARKRKWQRGVSAKRETSGEGGSVEERGVRATPAVCKNFIYSISTFTLSATLYLFLLQQYSLFHSLLYLNILFYYFTTFKYCIFYFSVLLFCTKNN